MMNFMIAIALRIFVDIILFHIVTDFGCYLPDFSGIFVFDVALNKAAKTSSGQSVVFHCFNIVCAGAGVGVFIDTAIFEAYQDVGVADFETGDSRVTASVCITFHFMRENF